MEVVGTYLFVDPLHVQVVLVDFEVDLGLRDGEHSRSNDSWCDQHASCAEVHGACMIKYIKLKATGRINI